MQQQDLIPLQNIPKIQVVIRKRPLNKKEDARNDTDIVQMIEPSQCIVKELKQKVDLTKYIEEHNFNFDHTFGENSTNHQIYGRCVQPLVQAVFQHANVTCFAYGQTGSGKTHTMLGNYNQGNPGLYLLASDDLFQTLNRPQFQHLTVWISFYEIYCGKLFDLLNERQELQAREDAKKKINIVGLQEKKITSVQSLLQIIEFGNGVRVTGVNSANSESSRSHAILSITIKENNNIFGKLSFIDLAGSERGADVADQNKQTRIDGAEINKSLLALKECIRAIDQGKNHTPFRGSKLTQVLRDSFIGNCKTVMIGNIAPSSSSSENTLNTLRYADRVKEIKRPTSGGVMEQQMSELDKFQKELMLPRAGKNTKKYSVPKQEQIDYTKGNVPQPMPQDFNVNNNGNNSSLFNLNNNNNNNNNLNGNQNLGGNQNNNNNANNVNGLNNLNNARNSNGNNNYMNQLSNQLTKKRDSQGQNQNLFNNNQGSNTNILSNNSLINNTTNSNNVMNNNNLNAMNNNNNGIEQEYDTNNNNNNVQQYQQQQQQQQYGQFNNINQQNVQQNNFLTNNNNSNSNKGSLLDQHRKKSPLQSANLNQQQQLSNNNNNLDFNKQQSSNLSLNSAQNSSNLIQQKENNNAINMNIEQIKNWKATNEGDLQVLSQKHEQLIQLILAEEEDVIAGHRSHIDDTVELVKQEMILLSEVDKPGSDVDEYVTSLDGYLAHKVELINTLRNKLQTFRAHLKEEEVLSKKFYESRQQILDVFDINQKPSQNSTNDNEMQLLDDL